MPAAGACAAPEAPAPAAGGRAQTIRLYDVSIDGFPRGMVARFYDEDGRLSLPAEQYEGLGFKPDEALTVTVGGERRVYLDRVPGLAFKVDERRQAIDITAPFDRLALQVLSIAPGPPFVKSRADWGAMLAYDAFMEWSAKPHDSLFGRQISTNLDARLFGPSFTAKSTAFLTVPAEGQAHYVRLETTVDFDDPDRSLRLRFGDSMTQGLAGAQSLRFGGVQWGTEAALRPDIITTPMPTLRQNLSAPTTLDVFVDGVQRYSRALDPGAFQISDLPLAAGRNQVQVVVTDAAGRRAAQTLPLYQSPDLLAGGRTEFNLAAGFERQDYALVSNAYGGGFASGHVEHGVNDRITVLGQAEAARAFWSFGGGGLVNAWNRFLIGAEASVSSEQGRKGVAWQAVLERTSRTLDVSISYGRASDGYRDLPGHFGYARSVERGAASVGLHLGQLGNFNVVYAVQKPSDGPRSQVASGTYDVELFDHQVHLSALGYADLTSGDWGAGVSLIIPLGRSVRATLGATRDSEGLNRSVELDGEAFDRRLEWEATVVEGPSAARSAEATWDGRYSDLYGRVARVQGSSGVQAEVAQSIVFMDHKLFVAGRIDDGFTVVDAPDAPHVGILLENRPVGRTDGGGRLLITDLQSYVGNAVAMDLHQLPLDVQVTDPSLLVAPRAGSGLVTRFGVTRERAAVVRLRLADGSIPPVGARARLQGGDQSGIVGYDGEVYLRGLNPGSNHLAVTWPGGACAAEFVAADAPGRLPRLGPVPCAP